MSETYSLGIIGGSGLYSMPGLTDTVEHEVETPFGRPSAPIVTGSLEGQRVAFLARHGIGHRLSPSEIPYRANLYALKSFGVERVVSISACGSLREEFAPGQIVVPDQILDRTTLRPRTFFGEGLVAHVSVADPFCPELSELVEIAVRQAGGVVHRGGTLVTIEGPRFSTRAESNMYRTLGMSLVGMTISPEAFLAREAEMCYAVMAHVTDYDVWRATEEPVSVELVNQTLASNTTLLQAAIRVLVRTWNSQRGCVCERALANALITDPAHVPVAARQRLQLLLKKYLP
jgi:5'-methylthioadenosine phosphorylase